MGMTRQALLVVELIIRKTEGRRGPKSTRGQGSEQEEPCLSSKKSGSLEGLQQLQVLRMGALQREPKGLAKASRLK